MKTNKLIVVLLALAVIMQGAILFNQYSIYTSRPPRLEPIRNAPAGSVIDLEWLAIRGSADADVILVEFSDFECPFCKQYAFGAGKEVEKAFISTGALRHAFANNPLPIHKNSVFLATAAICSGEQGRYWEIHDRLFESKPETVESVVALANDLSIEWDKFRQCMQHSSEPERQITLGATTARTLGLSGTPGFAIGRVVDGKLHVQRLIQGALPWDVFEREIKEVLSTKSSL